MTVAYRTAQGVDTTIARIFNTYGPRMRLQDGRAIPAFMSQALTGKPVTVFGDGRQTRSFCYVDDMVRGIEALLLSGHPGPVNIGNPREMTLLEMARAVISLTGSKSRIVHRPLPTDDPKVRQPDIRLARKVLRWEPRVDLKTGLRRTVRYFRGRLGRRG
jgi:dTDP-glucose 4,6-dehydratase